MFGVCIRNVLPSRAVCRATSRAVLARTVTRLTCCSWACSVQTTTDIQTRARACAYATPTFFSADAFRTHTPPNHVQLMVLMGKTFPRLRGCRWATGVAHFRPFPHRIMRRQINLLDARVTAEAADAEKGGGGSKKV